MRNDDPAIFGLLDQAATLISDEARSALELLTEPNPDFLAVRTTQRPMREYRNAIANQLGSLRQELIDAS